MAAVLSGEAQTVAMLLEAGADPDCVDEHGTPVLCLAVDVFDLEVVEVLMSSARLERAPADGRTPLLRAIDPGAYDITHALINQGARLWAKDAEGRDALALSRHWHETDVVAELHRRTGLQGPVERRTVLGEFGTVCEELMLAGLKLRTGHTAILTSLEPKFGIAPSFDELLARALAEADVDHEVWWATMDVLQQRHNPAIWDAAAALRDRPDPLQRYFGAELLRLINVFDETEEALFDGPLVDLFLPWVAQEPDFRVTRALAAGLADARDPRAEESLPSLTRHADSKVRKLAVSGLCRSVEAESPEALAALVERTADEDPTVRPAACTALASAPVYVVEASDALALCLADSDESVRVEAAARLALRDDPRGDRILQGLDAADEGSPHHWLLHDVFRYRSTGHAGEFGERLQAGSEGGPAPCF